MPLFSRRSRLLRGAGALTLVIGLVWGLSLDQARPDKAPAPPSPPLETSNATPQAPVSPPTFGAPQGKELRTETGDAYAFIERRYEPAYPLTLLEAPLAPARLSSPEAVLTSMASAIRRLDWPWFLTLWDEASRDYMLSTMARAQLTPARRLVQWRRNYVGQALQLTRRVDMAGYALLSLSPSEGDPALWAKVPPLALKRDAQGRWWLTHELRAHPVQAMDMGIAQVTLIERGVGP